MHKDLTSGDLKGHIVSLAIPAIIGYFFHTIFNVTDTFFAGLISTGALAALSLSASVFFMILAIAIGMSEAVTSLVGNALGEKKIGFAQSIVYNALVFATILSILLSIFGLMILEYLVELLGDPSYVQETIEYISVILYGVILFVGAFFLNAILNAIGDTISFRNILILTAILNVPLNYIFIEYFHMGVTGLAISTIICEAISMIYLLYKVSRTKVWPEYTSLDIDIITKLLKQGLPPSVNMFLMAFGMYIITYYVAPYGKEAVAAFGIGMRIEQLFLMPVVGINIATLAIVSQNNGAKLYYRIEPTVNTALQYGWIISSIGVTIYMLFAEELAALLASDISVIEETALYLRVSGLASYGFVVIFMYIAMLQGIGKPSVIMPISIYRQVVAPVVVFSVLALFHLDILYLWIALNAIVFSSAIFLWWYGKRKLLLCIEKAH